jgi:hypothetical protein
MEVDEDLAALDLAPGVEAPEDLLGSGLRFDLAAGGQGGNRASGGLAGLDELSGGGVAQLDAVALERLRQLGDALPLRQGRQKQNCDHQK